MDWRIVKETKELTGRTKFYIEKKRRFLLWTWWSRYTMYVPYYGVELDYDYNSLDEAKKELDEIREGVIKEVCDG
jgi:hypothetical protein